MAKIPDFTEIHCNAAAMRKASRRVTHFYDSVMAPSGIRSTQFLILAELYLRREHPPSMSELAASLVLDRSALGHNLQPLERSGFLIMQEDDGDRRNRHVSLTKKGRAKLRAAWPLWTVAQRRFDGLFGEREAALLRKNLLSIATDERLKIRS